MAVGIKTAYLNLGDKTVELDHSFLGVSKATWKNTTGNLTNINASNRIQYTYEEPSKPSVQITITRAGQKLIQKVMGKKAVSGADGLFVNGDRLPLVGIATVAPNLDGSEDPTDYLCLMDKARGVVSASSLSTNTDSKKNITYDEFTFNGNYSDKLGGIVADGDIPADSAPDVLKSLGWPDIVNGQGDFKDNETSTATTTPLTKQSH